MATLTPREVRQLKRVATEFGRRAKAGRTYYYIDEGRPTPIDSYGRRHILLSEIVFEPSTRSSRLLSGDQPRWYGPRTAADAYMQIGPLYEDRNHPDIRGHLTVDEWEKVAVAEANEVINSPEMSHAVEAAARGTAFRATWPPKKAPKKKEREKVGARR